MRYLIVLLFMIPLAACSSEPAPVRNAGQTNFQPNELPTSADVTFEAASVQWDRSASTIVFQADVVGGDTDVIEARNRVPFCTIYGDNRVVWTNEVGSYHIQVLFDQVSDDQIRFFVESLIISERFYDYGGSPTPEVTREVQPVVETLTLNVNGEQRITSAFDGWDYAFFQRILERCRTLSGAPVLFEPAAAWITAARVLPQADTPVVLWDAAATGVDLAAIAETGRRQWVEAPIIAALWRTMRQAPPGLLFIQGDGDYRIAVEVPNVSASLPPLPGQISPDATDTFPTLTPFPTLEPTVSS